MPDDDNDTKITRHIDPPVLDSGGFEVVDDQRDWEFFSRDFPSRTRSRGVAVRLRHDYPPHDQNIVNCCMSCALSTCMEILDLHHPPAHRLSPLFHYYAARKIQGRSPSDLRGMSFQTGFKALLTRGICEEQLHAHPISPENARFRPNRAATTNAKQHQITRINPRTWAYRKLSQNALGSQIVTTLNAKRAVALGFWLSEGYRSISERQPIHGPVGRVFNTAHVATVIGYDRRKVVSPRYTGAFLIKDSRGTNFGKDGHWWLPFVLTTPRLVRQAWVITDITY